MQPFEKKINTEESKENSAKPYDRKYRGPFPSPADSKPYMQHQGIDKPGDQRPDFLGVPSPVTPPCAFGPQGAGYNGKGEEREPYRDQPVIYLIERLQARQPLEKSAEML